MSIQRQVKTGKTLQEFPIHHPEDRVADYVWQCPEDRYKQLQTPIVAGAAYLQTHSITRDLSVLYLLTQRGNLLSGVYDSDTFGIDIKCYPLKEHTKRCLVVPIHGSQLVGLTGKCVCVGCILESTERARKQRKDIVKYVSHELLGVASITTTRADTVSQSTTGAPSIDPVNIVTREAHRRRVYSQFKHGTAM